MFIKEDGTYLTYEETKQHLYDCLAEGKEKLSFGEPCEGFDYKKGCPGHPHGG